MESPSQCINCGNEVTTAYCSACGQKHPPKKISILNLFHDFQSRIYGFDGMFPQTLKDLTIRPGKVAKEYIQGNRVKYVGPVGYFFVMLTIFILLLSILDVDFYELGQTDSPIKTATTKEQEAGAHLIVNLFADNLRIFQFFLIPFTAIWFRVFFKKSGYSFLEMMVPAFYFYGHLEILSCLNVILFSLTETTANSILFPFNFLYFGFASTTMFGKRWGPFFKGVLVYALAFVLFVLAMIIFTIVYMILNPEVLEIMRPA